MRKSNVEYLANYILENKLTIREASKLLDIPKSTLHYKVTKNLKQENQILYYKLHEYLANNFEMKHIRGGEATKKKWKGLKHHKN